MPIPTRIADKLRGRSFASFDGFRGAFWKEVASDPKLLVAFITQNANRMKLGLAPKTRQLDAVGKRRSFELRHGDLISEGGDVYDIANIRVNTPKSHITIHSDAREK